MPPPLKIALRLMQPIGTAVTEVRQRISRSNSLPRRQSKEVSGTLSALKNGMPATPMRTGAAVLTKRREIGGSSLHRMQSAQPLRTNPTSAHAPRHTQGNHQTPPLPPRTASAPQSNSALQQALTQSRRDAFKPPENAEEDAQLRQALADSHADAFLPPSSQAEEDAQLQQALAHSRADAFLPPTSHEEEHAQLQQALAQSLVGTPPHADEAPVDAHHTDGQPAPGPAHPEEMTIAQSTAAQVQMQAAMQNAQARTQAGKSMAELTKN